MSAMIICLWGNLQILMIFYLLILMNVAFLTLYERKILGLIQNRKGPFKVGYLGFMQPFSDAIKLFSKFSFSPVKSNMLLYNISPSSFFFLSLTFFTLKPLESGLIFSYTILLFLVLLSLGVYPTLLSGWSSNSKFSLIGSIRSITQTISYEVSIGFIIFFFCFVFSSVYIMEFLDYKILCMNLFMFLVLMLNFLIESNRTPFDLSECESELVSGFNVEYGGVEFSFIFLGENLMLIFNSILLSIFLSMESNYMIMWFVTLFILIRGFLPRMRLDLMINLCWLIFIPLCSFWFIFILIWI